MAFSTQRASTSRTSAEWAPHWKHAVFLSFRGEDTRTGFISHLYGELQCRQAIKTFKDDRDLEIGAAISPELLTAIEESYLAIIVLSPNYASSTWCLDELSKILECMQDTKRILPIFYHVDPSDVRNLRGSFAEAFTKHEEKFRVVNWWRAPLRKVANHFGWDSKHGEFSGDIDKLKWWRGALKKVGHLKGLELKKYRSEAELIKCIVKCVRTKLHPTVMLSGSLDKLVGNKLLLVQHGTTDHKVEVLRRLLDLYIVMFSSDPKFLSNFLRIIRWSWYPSKSLGGRFQPCFLAKLEMRYSKLFRLWDGVKEFPNLKYMDLSYSKKLISIPDFTGIPKLEVLNLEGCENLVEVHSSIAVHKKLKVLILSECKTMKSLPSKLQMDSLELLSLSGCSKVKKIPEFGEHMQNLSELFLDGTAIEQIPSTIEHLVGLVCLSISDCKSLLGLPSAIYKLKSLKTLDAEGCSKLGKLPGEMESSEELYLEGTAMSEPHVAMSDNDAWGLVLSSPNRLGSLTKLDLSGFYYEYVGVIPDDIGCLSSLKELYLSGNNFVSLSSSIRFLSELLSLQLERCKRLQQLPDLQSIKYLFVYANDCTSLKRLSDPSKLSKGANVYDFEFSCLNCFRLFEEEGWINSIFAMILKIAKAVTYPDHRIGRSRL